MKTYQRIFQIVLIQLFLGGNLYSQEASPDSTKVNSDLKTQLELEKNALYITGGLIGGFVFSGNYEHILWQNHHLFLRSVHLRAGVGKLWLKGFSGFIYWSEYELRTYTATFGLLAGRRNSFLEFGVGAVYLDGTLSTHSGWTGAEETNPYRDINLSMYLGYRYQKAGQPFVFRGGLGYPDGLYLSLGICF